MIESESKTTALPDDKRPSSDLIVEIKKLQSRPELCSQRERAERIARLEAILKERGHR
jgi:hypothetical protein